MIDGRVSEGRRRRDVVRYLCCKGVVVVAVSCSWNRAKDGSADRDMRIFVLDHNLKFFQTTLLYFANTPDLEM